MFFIFSFKKGNTPFRSRSPGESALIGKDKGGRVVKHERENAKIKKGGEI